MKPGASNAFARGGPAAPHARMGRIWQALALVLALFVLEQNLEFVASHLNLHPFAGTILRGARIRHEAPRRLRVGALAPDAPLALQGVKVGALIVPDRPMDFIKPIISRSAVNVTVIQDGKATRMRLVPAPSRIPINWPQVILALLSIGCLGFAAALILASRGRAAPLTLGAALAGYAEVVYAGQPLASGVFDDIANVAANLVGILTFGLFLMFARRLHDDATGRKSLVLRLASGLVFAAIALGITATALWRQTGVPFPLVSLGLGAWLFAYAPQAGLALALTIIADAWRRSRAERRRRYGLVLLAFAVLVIGESLDWLTSFIRPGPAAGLLQVASALAGSLLAPALFAYAILRHKVMDVGFAINRTLVYGVVSVTLLVAFGLLEWAAEHFIPIEGREKNAFIDAGLALVVFLAFHRVRDATEHVVAALFFRSWQKQEAELRHFLRKAPFITRPEDLAKAAAEALRRFAGGAEVAIYLREEDGGLKRIEGGLPSPAHIDVNHPALVSLRTDAKPLELDGASGLCASLAAPMLTRKDVTGAILLAAKPDAAPWRPDELELIGQAAVQTGQELHVLEVERLDRLATELKREVDFLRTLRPQPT